MAKPKKTHKKLKAVIMAAGESSRFKPLSDNRHKSLTKIGGQPAILKTIENLAKNGVSDIIIIHAPGERQKFESALKGIGNKIQYAEQKNPKGTGNALKSAIHLINSDFILMNASHEDSEKSLKKLLSGLSQKSLKLLTTESKRPWEYAVVELKGKKIKNIVEKPKPGDESSNLRTLGIYFIPEEFKKYIERAPEGPYSLIDAFNMYAKDFGAESVPISEEPASIKYAFDMLDVITQFTNRQKRTIAKGAAISKNAQLNGAVVVGRGTRIMENAVIHGPVYIGENCFIGNNVVIRENSIIENNVQLGTNTEVKHSHIGEGTHIHSGYVGDSVIGENCRVGAGFITGNRRIDRGNIKFVLGDKIIDSQKTYLGCVIGDETKTGIYASTMPGTIIGSNCIIGSNTEVKGTIPANSKVYSEKKIVIKLI